jgi:hypothetical protein
VQEEKEHNTDNVCGDQFGFIRLKPKMRLAVCFFDAAARV